MRRATQLFRKGERHIRKHLNDGVVAPLNDLRFFSGDQFVSVRHGDGGVSLGINIETLLPWVRRAASVQVLAQAAANYCTLSEAVPAGSGAGYTETFKLYRAQGAATEKRALIHFDRTLGSTCLIAQLVWDIMPDARADGNGVMTHVLWERTYVNDIPPTPPYTWPPATHNYVGGEVSIEIRPIRVDFDPAAISWNDAYVTGGAGGVQGLFDSAALGDEGNLGSPTEVRHKDQYCDLILNVSDPGEPWPGGSATAIMQTAIPDIMAAKLFKQQPAGGEVLNTWNAYDAIYGIEVRVKDTITGTFTWEAAGLDYDDSIVYAVRRFPGV